MVDTRTRIANILSFRSVDRLPIIEWAGWWTQTADRWHREGLPAELTDPAEIRDYFGLDGMRQHWFRPQGPKCPNPPGHGLGIIADADDYQRIREHLYPEASFDADTLRRWDRRQRDGKLFVWFTMEGFFWFPRTLFGIEEHLYAFHDHPELMHQINEDLLQHHLRTLDRACELCVPVFMTFAEDMSYNHGPMISRSQFDEFMAPYYRRIIPALKERGIIPFIDTDGLVHELVPWLMEVGVEGFLPLERMAGVDVPELRRRYPTLRMIGGFDKTVMHRGEQAIRAEFERLLPAMSSGGYVAACDHQTPPEVSIDDYRLYVRILKEYAEMAARNMT